MNGLALNLIREVTVSARPVKILKGVVPADCLGFLNRAAAGRGTHAGMCKIDCAM
jgi:hypothetical protein